VQCLDTSLSGWLNRLAVRVHNLNIQSSQEDYGARRDSLHHRNTNCVLTLKLLQSCAFLLATAATVHTHAIN